MPSFAPLCPHCGAPAPSVEALRSGYRCTYCDRVVDATAHPAAAPVAQPAPPPPYQPHAAANRAPPAPINLPTISHADATKAAKGAAGCAIPSVVVGIALMFVFVSPKTCATIMISGETESAMAAVRKCPRAMELLGSDPSPSWVGCANGQSESGCDSGQGSWSMPVSGSKARGSLQIGATKHKKSGWRADSVLLEVGDVRVDVMQCKDVPPGADD
jgi:hypothetical protein